MTTITVVMLGLHALGMVQEQIIGQFPAGHWHLNFPNKYSDAHSLIFVATSGQHPVINRTAAKYFAGSSRIGISNRNKKRKMSSARGGEGG